MTTNKKLLQLIILWVLQFSLISIVQAQSVNIRPFELRQLTSLKNPWSMDWLSPTQLIITEKEGELWLYDLAKQRLNPIQHNLSIADVGQGGLLDVIAQQQQNQIFIYVSYSVAQKQNLFDSRYTTAIAKGEWVGGKAITFAQIFAADYAVDSAYHFGSRLLIHDNSLYASIGERGQRAVAQQPSNHIGTIVRLNLDGSAHRQNPHFTGKKHWLAEIYQLGVRNPQGLAYHPLSNAIYISNHGARGGDFIGRIEKGGNYGWDTIGWGGRNYIGTQIGEGIAWRPPFSKPTHTWTPSIAVSQIISYAGKAFPSLDGQLLLTSLRDQSLRKIEINAKAEFVRESIIVKDRMGRLRDINVHAPTGDIYLLSNGPGGLWVMQPR